MSRQTKYPSNNYHNNYNYHDDSTNANPNPNLIPNLNPNLNPSERIIPNKYYRDTFSNPDINIKIRSNNFNNNIPPANTAKISTNNLKGSHNLSQMPKNNIKNSMKQNKDIIIQNKNTIIDPNLSNFSNFNNHNQNPRNNTIYHDTNNHRNPHPNMDDRYREINKMKNRDFQNRDFQNKNFQNRNTVNPIQRNYEQKDSMKKNDNISKYNSIQHNAMQHNTMQQSPMQHNMKPSVIIKNNQKTHIKRGFVTNNEHNFSRDRDVERYSYIDNNDSMNSDINSRKFNNFDLSHSLHNQHNSYNQHNLRNSDSENSIQVDVDSNISDELNDISENNMNIVKYTYDGVLESINVDPSIGQNVNINKNSNINKNQDNPVIINTKKIEDIYGGGFDRSYFFDGTMDGEKYMSEKIVRDFNISQNIIQNNLREIQQSKINELEDLDSNNTENRVVRENKIHVEDFYKDDMQNNTLEDTLEEILEDTQEDMPFKNRLNIIVGRGRTDQKGNKNLPLNIGPESGIDPNYIMYVDPDIKLDADIQIVIEEIDFIKLEFADHITDIRIYFDWSTFYCTAIHNIIDIIQVLHEVLEKDVTVYVPLYPEDKTIPSDVKRLIIDNKLRKNKIMSSKIKVMIVHDEYPLFDWNNTQRKQDLIQSVNNDIYLMIKTGI